MDNLEVRQSAQAIVIDNKERLILEKNKKIGAYSFIWGAFDTSVWDKTLLDTVTREFCEETWLYIDWIRFREPQLQPVASFWTWKWESTYFLLQVSKDEADIILANNNFIAFSNRPYRHFPIERKRFIEQVHRARNYFTSFIWN